MWHGDWSAADWAWISAAMLLFWTAIVAGAIWLVRAAGRGSDDRLSSDKREPSDRPSARDILDERYARGELTDEQYRARRSVLSGR
jgi:putative membrane protein